VGHGKDLAPVRDALDRAQPDAVAAAGGVAVAQGLLHVRDSGAAIEGNDLQGRPGGGKRAQQQLATAGMPREVGGELGDDQRDLAALALARSQPLRFRDRRPTCRPYLGGVLDLDHEAGHRHWLTSTA
jgi:hypothetical protein